MKVLILGKGFIGTELYKRFTDVVNISRSDLDYFDVKKLNTYLVGSKPEVLINCSGYTGSPNVDQCESNKEQCFKYNSQLPVLLETVCKLNNIRFIHISSGCIYSGYEKEYSEEDLPNFGINNLNSSTYSKSKHLAEIYLDTSFTSVLRLRMPFVGYNSARNYITKILKYDNLISMKNSITSVDDLCNFVVKFINNKYFYMGGIYNVVNTEAIEAKDVVRLLTKYGIINSNWKFVDINNLSLKANRSNCILSIDKIKKLDLELPNAYASLERDIKRLRG